MKKIVYAMGLSLLSLLACGQSLNGGGNGGGKGGSAEALADPKAVIASVGDQQLTGKELNELIRPKLAKVESEIYKIKKSAVQDWVSESLLEAEAKKQGVSVEQLLDKTTAGTSVSEQEIEAFYNQNKARIGDDFEKAKPQIVNRLEGGKKQQAVQNLLAKLGKDSDVKVNLEEPRIDVSADDDPSMGPKNAPVTLIEFSDFQCPFCKRTRETIKQIQSTYGDKVHYVFRDFPLSFHKNAPLAHQAANCAGDEGKYWEYNTGLWDRQRELERDNLIALAKTLGLNEGDFTKCIDSGKYADEIAKDTKDGSAAGVTGTPAYFINGRFLSGAQPFDAFKEIIDEELKK